MDKTSLSLIDKLRNGMYKNNTEEFVEDLQKFINNYEKHCFGEEKSRVLGDFLKNFLQESFEKIIFSL